MVKILIRLAPRLILAHVNFRTRMTCFEKRTRLLGLTAK